MFEFYLGVIIFWLCWSVLLIFFIVKAREFLYFVLKSKSKLILFVIIYAGIYAVMTSIFPNTKPILTESTLEELEFTEGYCHVEYYAARRSYINVGFLQDFDVSLCFKYNKSQVERKIDGKYIKVWHKRQMVYQIQFSDNDKILLSIDDANKNIDKYNFWIVPLVDFMDIVLSFILTLTVLGYLQKDEDTLE